MFMNLIIFIVQYYLRPYLLVVLAMVLAVQVQSTFYVSGCYMCPNSEIHLCIQEDVQTTDKWGQMEQLIMQCRLHFYVFSTQVLRFVIRFFRGFLKCLGSFPNHQFIESGDLDVSSCSICLELRASLLLSGVFRSSFQFRAIVSVPLCSLGLPEGISHQLALGRLTRVTWCFWRVVLDNGHFRRNLIDSHSPPPLIVFLSPGDIKNLQFNRILTSHFHVLGSYAQSLSTYLTFAETLLIIIDSQFI